MSWIVHLFRPKAELPVRAAAAVDAWRALPAVPETAGLVDTRFVVVDVETSGLNPRRDRLLSIGAVAVERMKLAPQHTFSVVLRNEVPSTRENIALHGLTPAAQAAGAPPEDALADFLAFVGRSPCVAFHADFDRTVLERALRLVLGVRFDNPWLDLARLAPALAPEGRRVRGSLDDWVAHFRLRVHTRHNAVHDAQVAAELFLILMARANARGVATLAALRALDACRQRTMGGYIAGV
ncbi:MAG TPA: 3'-5' exonuclease [Burkholderiales bacterium]